MISPDGEVEEEQGRDDQEGKRWEVTRLLMLWIVQYFIPLKIPDIA